MRVRLYTPDDYEMICEWWRAWKWDCLPEDYLPTVGAIAYDEQDICAAWLYETDSKFALIEWFISNPNVKNNRDQAISLLTDFLCDLARKRGFGAVVVLVSNQHLIKKLESSGFTGKHGSMTNMVRVL